MRLWNILIVLALAFIVAAAALFGLGWAARAWLRYPALPHPHSLSLHDWVSVLQLVFASVAGAGALVALIVAYRRQRVLEAGAAHDRTRVFNERFVAIAAELGDSQAAVRLAGVHAMAGLADDWWENRQTCVDVLCACLRVPYEPDPGENAAPARRLAFRADQQVRHSLIRVIAAHLQDGAEPSWQGLNFDFTGVVFDGGDFRGARFTGARSGWAKDVFLDGDVRFDGATFASGDVTFAAANFAGGRVSFNGAAFAGGAVTFQYAAFTGGVVRFVGADFSAGVVSFDGARFSGGLVTFAALGSETDAAKFTGTTVSFDNADFEGGTADAATVILARCEFADGRVTFKRADFSRLPPRFQATGRSRTYLTGDYALRAGSVYFVDATFSGAEIDFREAGGWSNPPVFSFAGEPPDGVMLGDGRPPALMTGSRLAGAD